jgi:tRNA (cytosine34-C5)-methyltransferase
MFPPTEEEAQKFNIRKCLRVLPHLQNTGGFFVAVLEKKKLLPWEKEINEKALKTHLKKIQEKTQTGTEEAKETTTDSPPKKKKRIPYGFKEDPFVFFEESEEIYASLKKFYELSEDFIPKNLLTRCKVGKKKNIYFVSDAIRQIIQNNENHIKLINSGVKTFSRCDNRNMICSFRLAHEGLHNVDAFIGQPRRLILEKSDVVTLLNNLDPLNPPQQQDLSETAQKQLESLGAGSCIVTYQEEHLKLKFVGWKGTKSLRAYVDTHDSVHMLRLLGADISKYEKNKFVEKNGNGGDKKELEQEPEEEKQEVDLRFTDD